MVVHPRVSVCVPLFNPHGEHVRALLTSLMNQSQRPDEVVLSDDRSQRTIDVLPEFGESLHLSLYRNDRNLGMAANWNAAVKRSSGDLVMVVSQDDMLPPVAIAQHVSMFVDDPELVLCGAAREFIGGDGVLLTRDVHVSDRRYVFKRQPRYRLIEAQVTRLSLRNGNVIGEPSAVMFQRNAFDRVGGYDEALRHAADLDFTLRVARLGTVGFINQVLLWRRIHRDSETVRNARTGVIGGERSMIVERYLPRVQANAGFVRRVNADQMLRACRDAVRAAATGRLGLALRSLRAAGRHWRTSPSALWERIVETIMRHNNDEL